VAGSKIGGTSTSGFETPLRNTRDTRESHEFTSMSSAMQRNQSRESGLAIIDSS